MSDLLCISPIYRLVGGTTEREWVVLVIEKFVSISRILVTSLQDPAGLKESIDSMPRWLSQSTSLELRDSTGNSDSSFIALKIQSNSSKIDCDVPVLQFQALVLVQAVVEQMKQQSGNSSAAIQRLSKFESLKYKKPNAHL